MCSLKDRVSSRIATAECEQPWLYSNFNIRIILSQLSLFFYQLVKGVLNVELFNNSTLWFCEQ